MTSIAETLFGETNGKLLEAILARPREDLTVHRVARHAQADTGRATAGSSRPSIAI
jgi:hypothetical protein